MNNLSHAEREELFGWIKGCLRDYVVSITFTKKDGTERVMKCTLNSDIVPDEPVSEDTESPKRSQPEGVIRVWDVEADGWRSFRTDSVKEISFSIA